MSHRRWPVYYEIAVQWGDMDAYRHVNNVIYHRWFESARIAWFLAAGLMNEGQGPGLGPILARATIDYRVALEFPDKVRIEVSALKLGTRSFHLGLRMHSDRHGDEVVAESENVIVLFDYKNGRPVPLGQSLRARIAELGLAGG